MPKDPIVVMKFGGSVLKDTDGFRRAAEIIKAEKRKKIVVVSAMAGVTDELYKLAKMATNSARDDFGQDVREEAGKKYREIWSKHLAVLRELDIKYRPNEFTKISIHLEKMLTMLGYLKEINPVLTDAIVSQGEKFSAIILSALVGEHVIFTYLPAKDFIFAVHRNLNLDWEWDVEFDETKKLLSKYITYRSGNKNVLFVTEGFVAGNHKGQTVTLGRNGSDYSAAIIGSLLPQVEEVQFWKDVPGVMTADPKLTMLATPISSISYDEIIEATHLGAKILHPESIAPLFGNDEKKVVIKNANAPRADGTEIVKKSKNRTAHGVTMLTVKQALGIFAIDDSTRSAEHLICQNLAQADIEFATVSQGFSDRNFTIISHSKDWMKIEEIFKRSVGNKFFSVHDLAQIAVIGSNMRGKPGIAGKFFTALGKAGVNIRTIQQGSSEYSMAATINDKDVEKAVVAVHDAFDLQKP